MILFTFSHLLPFLSSHFSTVPRQQRNSQINWSSPENFLLLRDRRRPPHFSGLQSFRSKQIQVQQPHCGFTQRHSTRHHITLISSPHLGLRSTFERMDQVRVPCETQTFRVQFASNWSARHLRQLLARLRRDGMHTSPHGIPESCPENITFRCFVQNDGWLHITSESPPV